MVQLCATCYPKMSKELNLMHEKVAHNRGEFTRTVFRGREKIICHTGTIDAAWSTLKDYIPNSLSSHNRDLLLYCKSWQWRYINLHANLQEKNLGDLETHLLRKKRQDGKRYMSR